MAERRPVTYDYLASRKRPVTDTVGIVLDPDLAEELEEARQARDAAWARAQARQNDSDAQAALWEAEEKLAQVQQRMVDEEAVVQFTFRSIGRAAYDALVDANPATPAQRAKFKAQGITEGINWNEETFPPALVAACLVEPKLSEAEVQALWRDPNWNQAELSALVVAAIKVNGNRRTADLGKGSQRTRSSAPS